MSGIQDIASIIPPNYTTQSGGDYPLNIDANLYAYLRTAGLFAPRSQPHPNENMTFGIDPGHVFNGTTLTEVGHWTSGITNNGGPPSPVIGFINDLTGVAVGDLVIGYLYVSGVITYTLSTNTVVISIDSASQIHVSKNGLVSAGCFLIFLKPIGTVVTGNAHGTTTIDNLQSTSGMFPGMVWSGTGATAGTTVTSIDSLTQIHVSANVTTGTGITFTASIPPPVTHPRIDRVCISTTTGLPTWVEGTEATTPVPPAIPSGYAPCCQVALTTSTTAITNISNLSDERDVASLGANPTPSEGSWTPVVAGSSVAGSQTYLSQVGRWIKDGDLVTFWANVQTLTIGGTIAGNVTITGLPFTSSNISNFNQGVNAIGGNITLSGGATSLAAFIAPNSAVISVDQQGSGIALTALPVSGLGTTSFFIISGSYRVG